MEKNCSLRPTADARQAMHAVRQRKRENSRISESIFRSSPRKMK